jgi:hypothetical protein
MYVERWKGGDEEEGEEKDINVKANQGEQQYAL